MDKKSLRLYYTYFIPITIIQSIGSIFAMTFLSVEDYGTFILYLSAVSFFFFLSLGIQNGYTILVKDQVIKEHQVYKIAENISIFYTILAVLSFPFLAIINIEAYWKLAFIAGCFNVIYIFYKSIFRTELKIHSLNIISLLFSFTTLIDILFYIKVQDIMLIIYVDVGLRIIISIIGFMLVRNQYKKQASSSFTEFKASLVNILRIGMPIMLGNWLISIYTIFDKTLIASDKYQLGLYSFAITSVLLIRMLLIPISELYFVTYNHKQSATDYYAKLNKVWFFSSCFVMIAMVGAVIMFNYLNLFTKFIDALPILLILLNILPLSISMDVYIYNTARRTSGPKFLKKAALSALITYSILFTYTKFFDLNLVIYSWLVYVTYLVIYTLFISEKLPVKLVVNLLFKNIIFVLMYAAVLTLVL